MQPCNRIYYFKTYWRLNMFRAAYRSSSGAPNCICSLWFIYPCGDRQLSMLGVNWQFPPSLDNGRSPHTYINRRLQIRGVPKNNENFFSGRERGVSSVCSRLVRVHDSPPHQLAKRRSWGKVCRVSVILFLSLCHCFRWFFDGRLKRTMCLHQVLFPFGENSSRNCHNASRGF